ncbi:hypothetical protein [Pseudomonas phage D6]|nr:hypothetical protein [Pseudomonas phage D6]
MTQYIFEVRHGDTKQFVTATKIPTESLFEKGKAKAGLDPKERNAFVVDSYKEARGLLDSMMQLSPAGMRRLLKVDKDFEEPVRVFIRRQDGNNGLIQTATSQRTYTFKEAA